MKTTIYLDDDLFADLKAQANASGETFRSVLNKTLRRGITAPAKRKRAAYKCPSFAMGQPREGISLEKALTLASDFEDEEIARKLQLRK